MKRALAIVILAGILFGAYRIYNSLQFQAAFSSDFYANIADLPFDVTGKGVSITIPLREYRYRTCYDVAIAVPGWLALDDLPLDKGRIRYRFTSDGRTLAQGVIAPKGREHQGQNKDYSLIILFVFDLPFPEAKNGVDLTLEVVSPFDSLRKYMGRIRCLINPDYTFKFDRCYHETLHI
ncbi:hypothetical protein [Pseudodesulfovibrio sp.]|uniref:hypothetical protein n=1 Tax=Pseudodesulfovibrio sp. TaxID=2035812 RepID=UPI002605444D|nr:hypothetical protein [Pseudodesulfovibrio sp.]MDD3311544.1 hypothetical protein [Pseudodesulfovibrio sp.]